MLHGQRIAVVVPARDEAHWIREVVETMPAFVDDVIVVDDGSRDATGDLARGAGATVLVHAEARGVGAAIVAGYRRALAMGATVVAVMAGDGQMCPADLASLVEPVALGDADYTKGDRLHHPDVKHVMPRRRRLMGEVLSRATALAVGLGRLSDSQSGYTAIHRRALEAIDLDAVWRGYGYPNDLLGHLARAGLRIADVVVRPVYRGEKSGLKPKHVLRIGVILARAALLRARGAAAIPTRRLMRQ